MCAWGRASGRPGRGERAAWRSWSCGGDRVAAIREERSAAPVGHRRAAIGHRRADKRGAGLASVESSATRNVLSGVAAKCQGTGPRRLAGQILP